MKKFVVLSFICGSFFFGSIVFAGGSAEGATGDRKLTQKVTYKLAHQYNPGHAWDQGAKSASKIIAEKTGGLIDIQVFPSSQLGTEVQTVEGTILGSIELVQCGSGMVGNFFKPILICEMPYLFRDNNHVSLFSKSDIAKEMFADLEKEYGIKPVCVTSFGIRHISSNKAITIPADLKGFKLRVPEQQVTMEYAKAMGADPTPVALVETYMALQQHLVDGQENPLSLIYSMKFYEVQKYVNLTGHVTNMGYFLMNSRIFNGLDGEYQKIILEAFDDSAKLILNIVIGDDDKLIENFKNVGVIINQPDVEAFRKTTAEMPEKFRSWWIRYGEDLYPRIQNLK
jgi:tripartite ATP-independent transporter DctP family solute receptor